MPLQSKWQQLPMEAINPASLNIDKLVSAEIIDVMLAEDRKMLAAVARERERIALAVDIITQALRKGGHLVFIGAGTSGRLGVLEAAEIPPTFGTSPDLVQGIMAGVQAAVLKSREGVEDRYDEGARTVSRMKPSRCDVFVGVSASGITPFVRGGLAAARKAGARIIFITCDPAADLQTFVDLTIALGVGPEVIAGSTRLKAASATKLVLNMLTAPAALAGVADRVLDDQGLFGATGAVHAAAAFAPDGEVRLAREDVGRHNAVHKVVGRMLLDGSLPAHELGLFVSGRASLEIVAKAWSAGFAAVLAVSAPTALAVHTARRAGLLLAGFVRGERVNVYAPERLGAGAATHR